MFVLSVFLMTAVGLLLGGMVFFSAVMMPLVFTRLPAEVAAGFARDAFPRYYLYLLILASLSAIVALVLQAVLATVLLATVAVLALYAREGLRPRINSARDAGLAGDAGASTRFHRLHHVSVLINLAQMIVVAVVFVGLQWSGA